MISIIIPSHNNLRHLKNAYSSIKKHAPEVEIVLYDDASTDGTWDWINTINDDKVIKLKSDTKLGHTILYDLGIKAATNEIVGIFHADMIMGPNYVENILKHIQKGKVICGTRIEPPLHPAANEKILMNFGVDFDDLDIESFENFVLKQQVSSLDITTPGMFAPWVIYKEDFERIGGHDWGFAPFPYEDSDIFQRWLLAGYELIQSRDALVYHLTCRGHRWTEEIGKNSDEFKKAEEKARKYYIEKWGSWIANNEYQHPILIPVYNKSIKINNSNPQLDQALKLWFNGGDDIIVEADGTKFTQEDFNYIMSLNQIVEDSGEVGQFELGNLKITINKIEDKSKDLIFINNKS